MCREARCGNRPGRPRVLLAGSHRTTLVTPAAATLPALKAARTPPVAAMSRDVGMAPRGLRLRGLIGGVVLVAGVAMLAVGVGHGPVVVGTTATCRLGLNDHPGSNDQNLWMAFGGWP